MHTGNYLEPPKRNNNFSDVAQSERIKKVFRNFGESQKLSDGNKTGGKKKSAFNEWS